MNAQKKIALVCVFLAVLLNPWIFGRLLSPDGNIASPEINFFILLFDGLFLAMGAFFFFTSRAMTWKSLKFYFGMVLLIVFSIEAGLQIMTFLYHRLQNKPVDSRLTLSIYQDKDWAENFFREYQQIGDLEIKPLIGWRTKTFSGEFIHVSRDGIRKTVAVPIRTGVAVKTIWVFGGSTVWGEGARDAQTIPSWLATYLQQNDISAHMVNYGERAYTNRQSLMRLITSLLEGQRPDLVIFYSGANEVIRPFLYGEPGIFLFSEFDNYLMQKDLSPLKKFSLLIMETIRDSSMIYKGLEKALHVFTRPERRKNVADTFTSQQLESLAEQIAENYRRSMQLLDNLSATYGFDYVTILQPVIFTKSVLSVEEKNIDSWTQNKKLKSLYLATYKKIDALHLANYANMANVFDAHEETIYMDFCHISEEGNAIIAEAMLQRIENYFEKGNPAISQSDERKNENNMGNLLTKRSDTFQIR